MSDLLFLAWRYVTFNSGRVGLLVALVTLAAMLPLSLHLLFGEPIDIVATGSPLPGSIPGSGVEPAVDGSMLEAVVAVVGATSFMLMVIALTLGLRLRGPEMGILARIGCSPARVRTLLALEALFIVVASGLLAAIGLVVVHGVSGQLLRVLLGP